MGTMEVHPGEGGADAQSFAGELAAAVGKHAGVSPVADGQTFVLHRL